MSMMLKNGLFTTLVLGTSLMLVACSSTPKNGKYPQKTPAQKKYHGNIPNYYTVRSGDTLSKIASRYGLDYRRLGALNGLDSNYTIKVGQRLRLTQPNGSQPNYPMTTPRAPVYMQPQQAQPIQSVPVGQPPVQSVRPVVPVQPYTPPITNMPPQNINTTISHNKWLPPVNGRLLRNFDEMIGTKGIWFGAMQGSPVVASKDGSVIYAGNGLPEYGNLIMISHADDHISAYAHLGSFTVTEKQVVKAGQQIGTVAFVPLLNQPAIEFQIRYKGMPINPSNMLK